MCEETVLPSAQYQLLIKEKQRPLIKLQNTKTFGYTL